MNIVVFAGDEHQQDNENQELKGNHDNESFVDCKHGKSSFLSDCFLSVGSFMIPILLYWNPLSTVCSV